MNLDIAQLRSFVVAAELGSIVKAATRLHRVPSALSMQLQKLEAQLGGALFQRTHGGLLLTERGRALLPSAMRMLTLNDDVAATSAATSSLPRLRVGTSDAYAVAYMPGILQDCVAATQGFSIDVRCGYSSDIWSRYERGELDVVLAQSCPSARLGDVMHVEALQWLAPQGTTIEVDMRLPLAVYSRGCPDREQAIHALTRRSIAFDVRFSGTCYSSLRAAVDSGMGVTAMLPSTAPRSWSAPSSHAPLPDLSAIEIVLARSTAADLEMSHAFAASCQAFFQKLHANERQRDTPDGSAQNEKAGTRPALFRNVCA